MGNVRTYNADKVKCALGAHMMTGYADDSFVTIEPQGDGITMTVGCDGEVNRSIIPDKSYTIKVALLQNSPTNAYLQNRYDMDQAEGNGCFPVIIKDLLGEEQFSADVAWVVKPAVWTRGKTTNNREWELACGEGKFSNG